jgi:hypothetical protein
MGEMNRAGRFIEKFQPPLLGELGLGVGTRLEVVSEGLSSEYLGNMVRHVITARVTAVGAKGTNVVGDEITLIVDGICVDLFDPETDGEEDTQDRLGENLLGAAEVARLWAEADL